jgi:hypothetical protein
MAAQRPSIFARLTSIRNASLPSPVFGEGRHSGLAPRGTSRASVFDLRGAPRRGLFRIALCNEKVSLPPRTDLLVPPRFWRGFFFGPQPSERAFFAKERFTRAPIGKLFPAASMASMLG